jgi:hypothetical protein
MPSKATPWKENVGDIHLHIEPNYKAGSVYEEEDYNFRFSLLDDSDDEEEPRVVSEEERRIEEENFNLEMKKRLWEAMPHPNRIHQYHMTVLIIEREWSPADHIWTGR